MDQERDGISRKHEEPRTVRMIRDLSGGVYYLKQSSLREQVSGQLGEHIMGLIEAMAVDHERQQIKHHMLCSWWYRDLTAILPTRNYQVGNVFLAFRNRWHLLTRLSFSQLNMCFRFLNIYQHRRGSEYATQAYWSLGAKGNWKPANIEKKKTSSLPQSHKMKHKAPF